jgi:hypothetical protein
LTDRFDSWAGPCRREPTSMNDDRIRFGIRFFAVACGTIFMLFAVVG